MGVRRNPSAIRCAMRHHRTPYPGHAEDSEMEHAALSNATVRADDSRPSILKIQELFLT